MTVAPPIGPWQYIKGLMAPGNQIAIRFLRARALCEARRWCCHPATQRFWMSGSRNNWSAAGNLRPQTH